MFSFANWDCLVCQVMSAYYEQQMWTAWAQGHTEAPEAQAQPCPPGAQALWEEKAEGTQTVSSELGSSPSCTEHVGPGSMAEWQ